MRVGLSNRYPDIGFKPPLGAVAKNYGTECKEKRLFEQSGKCHGAKRK